MSFKNFLATFMCMVVLALSACGGGGASSSYIIISGNSNGDVILDFNGNTYKINTSDRTLYSVNRNADLSGLTVGTDSIVYDTKLGPVGSVVLVSGSNGSKVATLIFNYGGKSGAAVITISGNSYSFNCGNCSTSSGNNTSTVDSGGISNASGSKWDISYNRSSCISIVSGTGNSSNDFLNTCDERITFTFCAVGSSTYYACQPSGTTPDKSQASYGRGTVTLSPNSRYSTSSASDNQFYIFGCANPDNLSTPYLLSYGQSTTGNCWRS